MDKWVSKLEGAVTFDVFGRFERSLAQLKELV